jgi:hypothetical protein
MTYTITNFKTEKEIGMVDVRNPEIVTIDVEPAADGTVTLWVNVNQVCRLRVQNPKKLFILGEAKEFI